MAAAAAKNLEDVRRTSEEIQAKLAAIQARLRNRARINAPDAPTPPSKSNRGKDEKK